MAKDLCQHYSRINQGELLRKVGDEKETSIGRAPVGFRQGLGEAYLEFSPVRYSNIAAVIRLHSRTVQVGFGLSRVDR